MLNENNVILIVGDLGSGINLVKNVISLDPNVDWPHRSGSSTLDRFNFIKQTAYPLSLKNNLSNWLTHEYKLRSWTHKYKVDISDNYADIATPLVTTLSQDCTIVFMTHWCEIANQLLAQYPDIRIISVCADTQQELIWQIKTYIDKIGIDKLQNFSFVDNIETQKQIYIKSHGLDSYHRFNVLNMYEILKERSVTYCQLPGHKIAVAELHSPHWVLKLNNQLQLDINVEQAANLIKIWDQLHEPVTEDCPWLELILTSEKYEKN
jgi:hypothetical protein